MLTSNVINHTSILMSVYVTYVCMFLAVGFGYYRFTIDATSNVINHTSILMSVYVTYVCMFF